MRQKQTNHVLPPLTPKSQSPLLKPKLNLLQRVFNQSVLPQLKFSLNSSQSTTDEKFMAALSARNTEPQFQRLTQKITVSHIEVTDSQESISDNIFNEEIQVKTDELLQYQTFIDSLEHKLNKIDQKINKLDLKFIAQKEEAIIVLKKLSLRKPI